ncbi:MAG: HAD-IIIC family phosphatase [Lachnospiraceae bacterium]|nr:HAD-IIIC family phosphatase [Lachnospiraceae bacterium]
MRELEYPFDGEQILKKSKKIKRALLEERSDFLEKRIAVLGGSTTHDIIRILELFLLEQGIRSVFYESEYAQYWQDVMFDNPQLADFRPDLIFIHTSNRNVTAYPSMQDQEERVDELLSEQYEHFRVMWEKIADTYHCPVIQNNFEYPFYRLLGNQEAVYLQGRISFLNRLNEKFYQYAREHENFYIHDINYLSASYGLDRWADPLYWHMYKYACCMQAIPVFAHNLANVVKAIFGKNKKALVLDLDNTLWGGVVGDDGPENLEIGQETPMGQVYAEFQGYVKAQKEIGVMLAVNSKNEYDNAIAGLKHPEGVVKPEDFVAIKANWEPKSSNMHAIAEELNILPDSLVFVDDNPAEREIVRAQTPGARAPEIGTPEQYIRGLDHGGFFEVTTLSEDDRKRSEMYRANRERSKQQERFTDYHEYLLSLEMKGTIRPFEAVYMARIAQLTNKSNQFNLTTRRYTQSDIEAFAADQGYITRYGKLADRFGDNGVVSVVIGRKGSMQDVAVYRRDERPASGTEGNVLHLELWLMSCRVLKRDMESAMMDSMVEACESCGIKTIMGYYYPTAKNGMVKDFFQEMGFEKTEETDTGVTIWRFEIPEDYRKKNTVIRVERME